MNQRFAPQLVFFVSLPRSAAMATFRRINVFLILAALICVVGLANVRQGNAEREVLDLHEHELTEEELEDVNGEDLGDGSDLKGLDTDDFEDLYEGAYDHGGFGEEVDEKDVIVLGSNNFTEFVKANPHVFVEFYAPWCGHCQALIPEWAGAATILKEEVPLAKVDATVHGELAAKYGVEGYPTLLFFTDGEAKPFTGHRVTEDIVKWVKKKIGPAVEIITSKADAEVLLETDAPIAIAYLEKLESREAEEFIAAARQEDTVIFYMTSSADVAHVFGLDKEKRPAFVLLKKDNEKVSLFDGTFERRALSDFVFENKLPLVITFSRETASIIFESDVSRQVLLFVHPDEYEKLCPVYEEASKSFKGKLIFVHVDLANEAAAAPVLDFFGIADDKTSIVGFVAEEEGHKFLFEGAITLDALKTFGEDFLANKLKPFLKSQPVPEKNDGDVKIVVANNFDTIVLDESKDVLLEIYAPWCGHCKSLEPEYQKLGESLHGVESVVITKMDGTKNEHLRAKVEGFPTLLLFPAGKKSSEPIPVDAERTVEGLLQFLKENVAIPFSSPKSADSQTELSEATTETVEERSPGEEPKDEL